MLSTVKAQVMLSHRKFQSPDIGMSGKSKAWRRFRGSCCKFQRRTRNINQTSAPTFDIGVHVGGQSEACSVGKVGWKLFAYCHLFPPFATWYRTFDNKNIFLDASRTNAERGVWESGKCKHRTPNIEWKNGESASSRQWLRGGPWTAAHNCRGASSSRREVLQMEGEVTPCNAF